MSLLLKGPDLILGGVEGLHISKRSKNLFSERFSRKKVIGNMKEIPFEKNSQ